MANDYATPGVLNAFSAVDVTEMRALGWTTANSGTTSSPPVGHGPTPAAAPTITSFSPDTGKVGDGITDANILTLTGAAEANSTVKIYDGATLLGSTTATASGAWSYTGASLVDGAHHFTATDTAGTSSPSTTLNVTVDTHVPNAPAIVSDSVVNVNEIMLSGTAETNATVKVYDGTTFLGSTLASTAGAWTYTTAALSDGTHTLTATATDVAGMTGAASQNVSLTIVSRGTTTTTSSDPSSGSISRSQADTFVFANDVVKDVGADAHLIVDVAHDDANTLANLVDELANAARVQTVTTLADLADQLGIHNNTPSDPRGGFHF